jgi:hypothetical protein
MKIVWSARVSQAAARYGENAPAAAVCCNACRSCVTTNLVALATGVALAAAAGIRRVLRRAS